jgi:hypothetical protein
VDDDGMYLAYILSQNQPKWIKSEAVKDLVVLSLANDGGWTVAHELARIQPEWVNSDEAKCVNVLMLKCDNGWTVAHELARTHHEWVNFDAAKSINVLMLKNNNGWSVAHSLATYHPECLKSEDFTCFDVVKLKDNDDWSVAHAMIHNHNNSIQCERLFDKRFLTIESDGKFLAEYISEKYGESNGLGVGVMAMKLIHQGAAFKSSMPLSLEIGEFLLAQAKIIMEDIADNLIKLKQIVALYSTVYHQVKQIEPTKRQVNLKEWQLMLVSAETVLKSQIHTNPELLEIEHPIDIFCEPGDELLKRLASERVLKSHMFAADDIEPPAPEISDLKGLY